jgi:protein TonB
MNNAFSPLSLSTAFSLAIHAALAAAIILARPDIMQATGESVDIELVNSSYLSSEHQTERAKTEKSTVSQTPIADKLSSNQRATTTSTDSSQATAAEHSPDQSLTNEMHNIEHASGEDAVTASTRASAHDSSIVEILHATISANKRYPYLAVRQRREGVARVEFILYPDGAIADARLIQSSRTRILDKAALDAVKGIEPFRLAKDYLDKPEAFQVDVVFNVM